MLGRFKAKVRDVDRLSEKIVVSKPEPLDAGGGYTSLLPVTDNTTGSSNQQKPMDTPPTGVRPNRAVPRMTASAKTQTGSSLPRVTDARPPGNSSCSELGRGSRLVRPTTLMPTAASVQRRRLPSPPPDDDDDVIERRQRRPHVTSPHSTHVTSARCPGTKIVSFQLVTDSADWDPRMIRFYKQRTTLCPKKASPTFSTVT